MAPKIAHPAPDFKGVAVVDGKFKTIQLSDYVGKYVVLFFYPLDFTFVCPTEIVAFSEAAARFEEIDCQVIGCSTDSHFSHLAWINTPRNEGGLGSMNIPLLADKSMEIAKAYDVLKDNDGITFRGLYIIDGKGILRQITVNDLPVGRAVEEVLRLVQAFQLTDKHGEGKAHDKIRQQPDKEMIADDTYDDSARRQSALKRPHSPQTLVCPANWRPGSATMKPDTEGSKAYFASQA